jgi:hypothetical protein
MKIAYTAPMSWFRKKTAKPKPPAPPDLGFNALNDLCGAAVSGDMKALRNHFDKLPPEYFATSLSAEIALVSACEGGQEEAVRYMLDRGVPPDVRLTTTGATPESMAAEGGHHHILLVLREYMIKAGKEPTVLMEQAQMLAEAKKMLEMTKVVTTAPVLQNDITVRDKPLKFKKPPAP